MSFAKTDTKLGNFIEAGTKTKPSGKQLAVKAAQQLNTGRLLWIVAVRHKVALLAVGNIVLVLNWAFPLWPQLVLGLIGK